MNKPEQIRLLYLTPEPWPTFRADVAVLFGKYLPRYGVMADLVTARETDKSIISRSWSGGKLIAFTAPRSRSLYYIAKLWHGLTHMIRADSANYDAIQVRDMPVVAVLGLIIAKMKGLSFFFWMSFPLSESCVHRAKARGFKAGIKFWFPLLQGLVGQWLLYRIVLPQADHVFVQSEQMVKDVAEYGISPGRMTPVPMGIDLEATQTDAISPCEDERLTGKRVAVYLGTLDRSRNIEVLFETLRIARQSCPELILVLVGDTEDDKHRQWLKTQAQQSGVSDAVIWTGWLPTDQGWGYVKAAEVGLSPFPRSYLLDSATPTKAIEYLGLGLPVLANDNPDQAGIIAESGGGLCVPLHAEIFAKALVQLLADPEKTAEMAEKGKKYIEIKRSYTHLAEQVANTYFGLF